MVIECRNLEKSQDSRLDSALMDPEGLLTASLQQDEQYRKKRMMWLGALSTMTLVLIGFAIAMSHPTEVSAAAINDTSDKTQEGWKLWRERKLEAAELAFLDAIRLNENDTAAWNGLGWARNNSGKHERAIEAFQKCLSIEPNHGAATNGIGQSNLALGNWEDAEKWLLRGSEEYVKQVPEEKRTGQTLPAAAFGLVYVKLITGKYDDAQKWAEFVLKYRPDDKSMAAMLEQAKKKDNSELKAQRAAMEKRIETAKSWKNFSLGNNSAAIKGFKAALAKNENDTNAINGLGFAILNSGHHEEAKPLFEKCLKLSPKHYGAMNGLARCLHAQEKTDEAIKLWEKLCDEVKTANAGTAALGRVYLDRKEYEKAIPYLRQMSELKGPEADYWKKALKQAERQLNNQSKS